MTKMIKISIFLNSEEICRVLDIWTEKYYNIIKQTIKYVVLRSFCSGKSVCSGKKSVKNTFKEGVHSADSQE